MNVPDASIAKRKANFVYPNGFSFWSGRLQD